MKIEKRGLKKNKLIADLNVIILIGFNDIDVFLNCKILESYEIYKIVIYKNAVSALSHLAKTDIRYKVVMIDIYMPLMDGFEFIDKFNQLQLHKKQGNVCILSASLDPIHKEKSMEKNVGFIEKPLTIEKLLIYDPLF